MKSGRLLVALFALALLLLEPAMPVHAACSGVTFTNSNGGDWEDAANWSTGLVPNASDDVCIQKVNGLPVTVKVNTASAANSVTLEEENAITVYVHDGAALALLAAENFVINDGTITLDCEESSGGAGLTANGVLGIHNSASGVINVLTGSDCTGSTRAINGSVTNDGTLNISKSLVWGAVANVGSTFNNNGTINIVPATTFTGIGMPLLFNQNGGSLNIGAADGFTLIGAFHYNGGTLPGNPPVLSAGSTLDFAAGSAVSTVEIIVANGAVELLNDIMLGAVVRVQTRPGNGAYLTMSDNFTNNGEIWLDGTTGVYPAQLVTDDGITLTNAATASIKSLPGGGQRSILANITNLGVISVTKDLDFLGAAGDSASATVNNQGLFQIGPDVATTTNSNVTLNQSGNLTIGANANLTTVGPLNQSAGVLKLSSASSVLNVGVSGLNLQGGILSGRGVVNGNIQHNGGQVSPGESPGQLTVNGDYVQGADSTLTIEIAGVTPAVQYDRLEVNGNVTLAGTLNISFTNGFAPAEADTFEINSFDSRSGVFKATNMAGLSGKDLSVIYSLQGVTLAVPHAVEIKKLFVPSVRRTND